MLANKYCQTVEVGFEIYASMMKAMANEIRFGLSRVATPGVWPGSNTVSVVEGARSPDLLLDLLAESALRRCRRYGKSQVIRQTLSSSIGLSG
jgi:hypothetical protein